MARKGLTVSVSRETKDLLDSIRHPGQSYDDLIQELVKFWESPWPASFLYLGEHKKGVGFTSPHGKLIKVLS